jgi:dolichol-phosphate mannosyltransferase
MEIISIVIPVFQNEESLYRTISTLVCLSTEFNKLDCELEFIFVDDGSFDDSIKVLQQHLYIPNMTIIKLTRNFGQIPAIQAGVKHSRGKYIGVISADLQDPPELFLEMYKHLKDGSKLVIAERESRDESFFKRVMSRMYWGMIKKYSMENFPSGGFDFCMFDRQVAREIDNNHEKNTNIFPLIFWFGFKPRVISYRRKEREHGKSMWTFFKKVKLTIDTIIGFTYLPTRIISIGAISVSLLAFLYSIFILSYWLLGYGYSPDGWTSIILLILIIGGGVLFSLGIVGEYLLRILDEVRDRPSYIIDDIYESERSENED